MYLGKLLVGITTPLVFSYASIGIYLILVSRRDVEFPSAYMLALIFLLTFAHAVLMVSAAIVRSSPTITRCVFSWSFVGTALEEPRIMTLGIGVSDLQIGKRQPEE